MFWPWIWLWLNGSQYLGIHLDRHFTFAVQCDELVMKLRSHSCILRNYISKELALLWHEAWIEPRLSYVDIVYDVCTVTCKRQLQLQQNVPLRAVLNTDRMYPTTPLHTHWWGAGFKRINLCKICLRQMLGLEMPVVIPYVGWTLGLTKKFPIPTRLFIFDKNVNQIIQNIENIYLLDCLLHIACNLGYVLKMV